MDSIMLSQMKYWLPLDISTHGVGIDRLINIIHVFMLLLFVGWGIFFVMCVVKFRSRPGHKASYAPIKAKASKYAEFGVIGFEIFLLLGLSTPVWGEYKGGPVNKDGTAKDVMAVRVIAQQFAWNVHYPGPDGVFGETRVDLVNEETNPVGLDRDSEGAADDYVDLNILTVPKGKVINAQISSKDVIHGFGIPMLRVKQDAIPGMRINVWFEATMTSDEVRAKMHRTVRVPAEGADPLKFSYQVKNTVAVEDIDLGSRVVEAGDFIWDTDLEDMQKAGLTEILVAPSDPVEIHCAQLCGLNHYSMRGRVVIKDQADFDTWYDEAINPPDFGDFDDEGGFDN